MKKIFAVLVISGVYQFASGSDKCVTKKIFVNNKYASCEVIRENRPDKFEFSESYCETFCNDPCNSLGFSATKYLTLAQFFESKKLPYSVIYRGNIKCQREAAEQYLKRCVVRVN